MTLTNQEAALLGLLSEEPMHPYKIESEVQFRDMRSWTGLSMSSIYKLLRKLEKEGLVKRENKISPENRLQKLYSISDEGKKILKIKLAELFTQPDKTQWSIDIALYNADLVDPVIIKKALYDYRKALEEKIQSYKDLHKFLEEHDCPPHRFQVALRPIYLWEAEIKWIGTYLETL